MTWPPCSIPETFTPRGGGSTGQGIRAAARRADLVITGSQAAADELAAYTAIPTDRVRVVHNGVDATPAPPAAVAETARPPRPGRSPLRALRGQPRTEKEPPDPGVGLRPHARRSTALAWPWSDRPAGSVATWSTGRDQPAARRPAALARAGSTTATCGPCTPGPASSPSRASTRASACRSWRPWSRAPRWSAPTSRRCGK